MDDALLVPEACVAAGAAFGQAASRPPHGGLVVAASRFVEYGSRATLLIVPGLFRLDLQPERDSIGLRLRELGDMPCDFAADPGGADGVHHLRGTFQRPDGRLQMRARVATVADADVGGVHAIARAAIVEPGMADRLPPCRLSPGDG